MYPLEFDPETTFTDTALKPLIAAAVQTLITAGHVRIDDRLNNALRIEHAGAEIESPILQVNYSTTATILRDEYNLSERPIFLIVQINQETGNKQTIQFNRGFGRIESIIEERLHEQIYYIREWVNKKRVRHLLKEYSQPFRNPLGDVYVGRRRLNYPSGAPHFEMNYNARGELDGPYKKWNGKMLSEELMFVDGKRHGTCLQYFMKVGEPQVCMETRYENGKKHGLEIIYNSNGTISHVNEFTNGKKTVPVPSD